MFYNLLLSSMKDRIQRILDYYQLTASEFAKIVGVNASGISHILSGNRTHLSTDTIIKLSSKFPEINLEWLILGRGEMRSSSRQTQLFEPEILSDLSVTIKPSNNQVIENKSTNDSVSFQAGVLSPKSESRKIVKIVTFFDDNTYQDFFP